MSAFANCGRAVAHVRGSYVPITGNTKFHSITWSARARIEGGIVIPSALAIFRSTIRSILVGRWMGRSEGLAPLRILST